MSGSKRLVVGGIVIVLAVASGLAGAAMAGKSPAAQAATSPSQANPNPNGITVQGEGRVLGVPDVMRLNIGVEVQRANVQAALDAANKAAAKVTSALRHHGVAAKDIQTTGLSISPQYDYSKNGSPRITGYSVSNQVEAKLRDLKKAGATIQAAATSAGNAVRIDSVSFDLEDNVALLKDARAAAFADAKAKAEQYANLSGRRLGKVVSITETPMQPEPIPYKGYLGAVPEAASAPVPVSPGQQKVSVLVTVVYAFD